MVILTLDWAHLSKVEGVGCRVYPKQVEEDWLQHSQP